MQKIHIETVIAADISKVWTHWNSPESIKGWAFASETWECPYAENNPRTGGRFLTRMSAKDGSASFDFAGTYTEVHEHSSITYQMDKEDTELHTRECVVTFTDNGNGTTKVTEDFDSEDINSIEMQQAGWSAILENFKKFVETN